MTKNLERNWDHGAAGQPPRQLQLVRAGSSEFAIFADEVAAIVPWREPTPLPGAAASVLGVVSIQGRMLTVLDLAALPFGAVSDEKPHGTARQIVALKGDEQLALAVDEVGETIPLKSEGSLSKTEDQSRLVYGTLARGNKQTAVLNSKALFPAAIQGRERRRRRF